MTDIGYYMRDMREYEDSYMIGRDLMVYHDDDNDEEEENDDDEGHTHKSVAGPFSSLHVCATTKPLWVMETITIDGKATKCESHHLPPTTTKAECVEFYGLSRAELQVLQFFLVIVAPFTFL
jgi:hypothetical protein